MSNNIIPKGQYGIKPNSIGKIPWPILTAGSPPEINLKTWKLRINGEIENPKEYSWNEFLELGSKNLNADMHCVTKWTINNMEWEGIDFYQLVKIVKPKISCISVCFKAYDDVSYSTSVRYDPHKSLLFFEFDLNEKVNYKSEHSFVEGNKIFFKSVLLATKANGELLTKDHGGPMRIIIPDLYAWKGTKFCREITFSDIHELGFWETRGYSDSANPFTEDRFVNDLARKVKADVYYKFRKLLSK